MASKQSELEAQKITFMRSWSCHPLAKAVQTLKGCSSKHLNETAKFGEKFAWQEGYGAFSVSVSQTPVVVRYIENQAAHHARCTFEEEFVAFLRKHGLEYDPKYVLG